MNYSNFNILSKITGFRIKKYDPAQLNNIHIKIQINNKNVIWINKNNNITVIYPNITSTLHPIPHGEGIPIPNGNDVPVPSES